ncbi:MAG: carbamoyltransferase [Magnetococcales bacterium]|nr:carbamoyltransferase [Magnetococcales bacterium]
MSSTILGISAHYHNAAACLLCDGKVVAAAEEERFSRIKHDPSLPKAAVRYCLREAGLTLADVDCIAYYELPWKKLSRQIWMGLPNLPCQADRISRMDPQRPEREIRDILGFTGPIEFVEHHQAHAASAYHYSGFSEAAILTVDGVGEWTTTSYGRGTGDTLELLEEVDFPNSIGLLYSTVTSYLGFRVNGGEYKVMGLAPYGQPRYADALRAMIRLETGGQYRLDMRYFDFLRHERMYSDLFIEALGAPPRPAESELQPFHLDVARSIQVVLEEIMLAKVRYLHTRVPSENLCLAGGVALNCVANHHVLVNGPFRNLFVQPAANDAGGALGAAALAHLRRGGVPWPRQRLGDVFLGPGYSNTEIARMLAATPLEYEDFRGRSEDLFAKVAAAMADGKVVGWFQGRMEFGPRALGSRSILADPRNPTMRDHINALVKKREAFRPFAPSVLLDEQHKHFALDHPSPFMLETCPVHSPLDLPAITHVDASARVQSVSTRENPRYAALLQAFFQHTGCPLVLNTSFNMRSEPIVCSPRDALYCFVRAGLDLLVLEDFLITRETIPSFWAEALAIFDAHVNQQGIAHRVYTFF